MKILKTSTFDAMQNEIKNLEQGKLNLMKHLQETNNQIRDLEIEVKILKTENDGTFNALQVNRQTTNKLKRDFETATSELELRNKTISDLSETNVLLIEERDALKLKLARPKGKNKIVEEMIVVPENVCDDCPDCECGAKNEVEPQQSDDDDNDEQEND